MLTALMKFTGCSTESIGLPGRSLATCTCHEKLFESTYNHPRRHPLIVRDVNSMRRRAAAVQGASRIFMHRGEPPAHGNLR
jgi:hypothetical protein